MLVLLIILRKGLIMPTTLGAYCLIDLVVIKERMLPTWVKNPRTFSWHYVWQVKGDPCQSSKPNMITKLGMYTHAKLQLV